MSRAKVMDICVERRVNSPHSVASNDAAKRRRREPAFEASAVSETHISITFAIFLLALIVRGLFFLEISHSLPFNVLTLDAREYFSWAKRIADGHILSDGVFFTSPLYAYFLAAIFKVFGANLYAVRAVQMFLGSLVPVFLFFITRRVFGKACGIIAGVIACVYGPFIYYDALVLKTSLEIFLVSLGFILLFRAGDRGGWMSWFASGIIWGLAVATKENNLLFIPCIAVWLAMKDGRFDIRKALRPFALVLAGIAIPIIPITAQNAMIGHDRVLIGYASGANFYQGNFRGSDGINIQPDFSRADPRHEESDWRDEAELRAGRPLKPSEISKFWFHEGLKEISSDPLFFAKNTMRKIALVFNRSEPADNYPPDFYYRFSFLFRDVFLRAWPVLTFGLFGFFLALSGNARRVFLPVSFLFAYTASLALFHVNSRYRLPVIWALIPFAAFGIAQGIAIIRRGELKGRRVIIMVFAACFLIPAVPLASFTSADVSDSFNTLGQVELDGKYDEATEFYREAIAIAPANHQARINLIEALISAGKAGGAKDSLLTAIKKFPGVDRYYILLGIAIRAEGKSPLDARNIMREVYTREGITKGGISLDPDAQFRFLVRSGLNGLQRKDYQLSIKTLSYAQKIKPDSAGTSFLLAQSYELNGDIQPAIAGYRRALATQPMFLAARYNIAMNEFKMGNKNSAIAELKIIRSIVPEFADTEKYLGR